jgi:predicted phage terminase large subunit-like protein
MPTKNEVIARAFNRLKVLKERERAEERLIDFAEYVWPVVEPAIPFIKGWAIEAICEHLEAVTHGHIKRLLINVPLGFTKSLMTDVFWPAWEWGPRNKPWLRYVCASYSNHLTERDNMRCRNVVLSDRYRRNWGNRFAISNEQFTKVKFANNKTGWKLATSVGGIGVGERGDRFVIDDANNTMQMESEAIRDNTNMWFTEVVPDRLNNPRESAIIVIQQRLHEDDVSGVAISRGMGYTHLMIPMEHDPARHCVTVLGLDAQGQQKVWEDPRTEDGELAWPERFPLDVVDQLRRDKGPYAWAGQYQQSPEPRGGSIIKRDYWQLWEQQKYPPFEFIVASLDSAYTAKEENDPSALTVWGMFRDEFDNPKVMLIWAWQDRLEFHELVQFVTDVCSIDPHPKLHPRFPVDKLLIENKANGLSIGQEMYRLFGMNGKFGIEFTNPKNHGDKVARVQSVQHLFTSGMVFAPDRAFADEVIDQCAKFPKGSKDDLVDTTSQALRWLRDMNFMPKREERQLDLDNEVQYRRPQEPIYPV